MRMAWTTHLGPGSVLALALLAASIFAAQSGARPGHAIGQEPQAAKDVFLPKPPGVTVTPWVEDLRVPWSLVFLPDGRALVSERQGRAETEGRQDPQDDDRA